MTDTADHGAHGLRRTSTDRSSPPRRLLHQALTDLVLGSFFVVYRALGSGFVEGVYAGALALELRSRGVELETEKAVSVQYRGAEVGRFRADMVVQSVLLVELKAADRLVAAHEQQVINYLKATELEVALLLNFGPRPTFKRFVLTNNKKHLP